MKPINWFRFENAANDATVAEIHIVDVIGDWIDELINEWYGMKATLTAKGFLDQLSKLDAGVKTIRVHINSPGGDVFAALNIANALRDQQLTKGRTVETIVDGLAASAASIIAMAGKTVTMADNALMMIHNPWTVAFGSSADMRKAAETLDTVRDTIVATYKWHSSLDAKDIVALIDAETWLSADDAVEKGFATDKVEGLKAAASIAPGPVAALKVPPQYRDRVQAWTTPAPVAASAVDVLQACNAAGLDLPFAKQLVAAALPMDQVTAKISAEQQARGEVRTREEQQRTAAATRATEIRAACHAQKFEDRAEFYINSQASVSDVKADLLKLTAQRDKVEIDAGLNPSDTGRRKPVIDTAAIYAARNK